MSRRNTLEGLSFQWLDFARVCKPTNYTVSPAWQGRHVEKVMQVNLGDPQVSGLTPTSNLSYKVVPKWAWMCLRESEQTIVVMTDRKHNPSRAKGLCFGMFLMQGRTGISPLGGRQCP